MLKLGTVIILFFCASTAFADKYVYLINTHSSSGEFVQGAAYTDSNRLEVNGYVILKHDSKASFAGVWTRSGKIEAVDRYGNVYLFDVIKVLDDKQVKNLVHNF